MVSEPRKQLMAWMEMDYSKDTHFRWKIKWRLEHLGATGIMSEMGPLTTVLFYDIGTGCSIGDSMFALFYRL